MTLNAQRHMIECLVPHGGGGGVGLPIRVLTTHNDEVQPGIDSLSCFRLT